MEATLVSKGEFAALINVSPGRVSQFIAAGQISAAAIVGSGQRAKIDADRARADLRMTLDVSQRLGNGIETRLDAEPSREAAAGASSGYTIPPIPQGIDYEIKQQKLEQARRANRNAAIADAQSRGQLIDTEQAKAEMSRVAAAMLQVFEGALTDLASAMASEFKVPQRDALHLLRKQFRLVRVAAAKHMVALAVTVPDTIETPLAADDLEMLN